MTVFVYVNTSKQGPSGDPDHIKVFANVDAAEKWFEDNDPEGAAFEYEVPGVNAPEGDLLDPLRLLSRSEQLSGMDIKNFVDG
jgi:hypothetical protein